MTSLISDGIELFNPPLERGNLVATLPTMGPYFILKMNITINSLPDAGFKNIFQVTDETDGINENGQSFGTTGDRYPWLSLRNTGILLFQSEKDNVVSPWLLEFTPTLGTKHQIEMRQIDKSGATFTEIIIDDEELYSDENTAPIVVENAKVYLANVFRQTADATVEYFYLESY